MAYRIQNKQPPSNITPQINSTAMIKYNPMQNSAENLQYCMTGILLWVEELLGDGFKAPSSPSWETSIHFTQIMPPLLCIHILFITSSHFYIILFLECSRLLAQDFVVFLYIINFVADLRFFGSLRLVANYSVHILVCSCFYSIYLHSAPIHSCLFLSSCFIIGISTVPHSYCVEIILSLLMELLSSSIFQSWQKYVLSIAIFTSFNIHSLQ